MEAEEGRADQQSWQVLFPDPPNVGVGVARGGGRGPAGLSDGGEAGEATPLPPTAHTCQDSTSTISQGSR